MSRFPRFFIQGVKEIRAHGVTKRALNAEGVDEEDLGRARSYIGKLRREIHALVNFNLAVARPTQVRMVLHKSHRPFHTLRLQNRVHHHTNLSLGDRCRLASFPTSQLSFHPRGVPRSRRCRPRTFGSRPSRTECLPACPPGRQSSSPPYAQALSNRALRIFPFFTFRHS